MTQIGKSTEELLNEGGEAIVKKLREQLAVKQINNTKLASDSLSYEVKGNKLLINGLARIAFLEFGRSPGGLSTGNTGESSFLGQLRKWVETKLGIKEEKKRNSVAYLIMRKIQREGTDIFSDRSKGIQIEVTLEEINNIIFEEVSTMQAFKITDGLINLWNKK